MPHATHLSAHRLFTKYALLSAAAIVGLGLTNMAAAVTYTDAADGAWDNPATWGGTAPTNSDGGDVLYINQFNVSTAIGASNNFTGGKIYISGAGELRFTGGWTSAAAAIDIDMNGGTLRLGNGNTFSAGNVPQYLNISGVSTIYSSNTGDTTTLGGAGSANLNPLVLSGSGTFVKFGTGSLRLNAYESVVNDSTFDGTMDVREGNLLTNNKAFLQNATVILHPYMDGAIAKTATLDFLFGGTTVAQQPTVKNLYGTGSIRWNNASGYARDLVITGEMNPGFGNARLGTGEAGTLTRINGSSNDLLFATGSSLIMDVFSATSADQLVWGDTVGTSVMNFSLADLIVRIFTPAANLSTTEWVLINGDEFGTISALGGTTGTPVSDMAFNSITYDADAGWSLSIEYRGEAGSSNRQVVLVGSYTASTIVPEPASLAMLGLGAVGLFARRRR